MPSDTFLRFAVLSATLFAATASMYRHLGLLLDNADAAVLPCLHGLVPGSIAQHVAPDKMPALRGIAELVGSCASPFIRTSYIWSVSGLLALGLLSWVLMLALPRLSVRRGRLARLDLAENTRTAARLVALEAALCLPVRPVYWIAPDLRHIDGRAFGTAGHPQVSLNTALVASCEQGLASREVDATILHELAHLARRDVGRTYLAVASWWAFLAVTVVPFVVTTAWRSAQHPASQELRPTVSAAALVALVYLARAGVLRHREFYADAAVARVDGAAIRQVLERAAAVEVVRSAAWLAGLGWHPSPARRLAAIDRPEALLAASLSALLLAGVAVGVISAELIGSATALVGVTGGLRWGLIGVLIVGTGIAVALSEVLVVTGWRAQAGARLGGPPVSVVRPALVMAAGFLIGEPLSITSAATGTWGTLGVRGRVAVYDELISAGMLAAILCLVSAWAVDSATGWNTAGANLKSVRRRCQFAVVVGFFGILPTMLGWSLLHRLPIIGQFHLYRPGTLSVLIVDSPTPFLGPFTPWVEVQYYPLEAIAYRPWCLISLAVPVFAWCCAATRSALLARSIGSALRAGVIGIVGYGASAVLAGGLLRWWLHDWYLRQRSGPAIGYLLTLDTWLVVLFATIVAVVVAARTRVAGSTLGILAALVTAVGSAVLTPVLVASLYGLARAGRILLDPGFYQLFYGLAGISAPIRVMLISAPIAVLTTAMTKTLRFNRANSPDRVDGAGQQDLDQVASAVPSGRMAAYAAVAIIGGGVLAGAFWGWLAVSR